MEAATSRAPAGPELPEDLEQKVTPLELFFDLVFVFAFTQVTQLMSDNPTWEGLAQGMLVLAAVWFAWASYGWLTDEVEHEETIPRLAMFAVMGSMLVAALAIPDAFGADALAFGICYFITRVLHIVIFAYASPHVDIRDAILNLAPTAIGGPALLIAASGFDGTAQAALWIAALTIDYAGPYVRGVEGFSVSASHFAERFGLIVIIALGESIVAVGAGASDLALDAETIGAALGGIVIAATLWWTYFDVVAVVAERRLVAARGLERAKLARDSYSYLHLPMIAGIVLVSLGIKKTLADTSAPLETVPAVALCGGVALYLLGHVAFRLRNVHTLARRRLVVSFLCLAVIPVATEIDAIASVGLIAALTVSLTVYEVVRFGEPRARLRASLRSA